MIKIKKILLCLLLMNTHTFYAQETLPQHLQVCPVVGSIFVTLTICTAFPLLGGILGACIGKICCQEMQEQPGDSTPLINNINKSRNRKACLIAGSSAVCTTLIPSTVFLAFVLNGCSF